MNAKPDRAEKSIAPPFARLRVIGGDDRSCILETLPHVILALRKDGVIVDANAAAESFFEIGKPLLIGQTLERLLPFGSSLLTLIGQVRERGAAINEYKIDLGRPGPSGDRRVDVHCAPLAESDGGVLVVLQERTIADKIDRQLTHQGAARSVSGLAAMLAHEIKNPLSGIRGAAQLLETNVSDEDRVLTQLICEETDRIVKLVDRMQAFSDERPISGESLNIHAVLDHVRRLAAAGFAKHIRVSAVYDPSLPNVLGSRDQLVQVFLNLVKNAAEAIGEEAIDGEIIITTAYRAGVRLKTAARADPVSLPLEICIRDNGPGVPADIAGNLFDPFVTTKASGSGLGLALVAKVIRDHGGIVEWDSLPRRTTFRVLMPLDTSRGPKTQKKQAAR